MAGETWAGTQGEPSTLSSFPTVNEIARFLRIDTTDLRVHLRNQGYHLNPEDRIPYPRVIEALEHELDQGRAWQPIRPLV